MKLITLLLSNLFVVNDASDLSDTNPGDGICQTSSSTCTFRAAIEEANALPGWDTIRFSVSKITLNAEVDNLDTLYVLGRATVDSIVCSFVGDCIYNGSYLFMDSMYVFSKKTSIANYGSLVLEGSYMHADTFAIYAHEARTHIYASELTSRYHVAVGIYFSDRLVVKNSRIVSRSTAIHFYDDEDGFPDTLSQNTVISDGRCILISGSGRNLVVSDNHLTCKGIGLGIYDVSLHPSVPESVRVEGNTFNILSYGDAAISVIGCNYCRLESNVYEGTDTSGMFIYARDMKHGFIYGNINLNDAGMYNMIELNNVDSSIVRRNRIYFSNVKDSTGGINLGMGSEYNLVDSNKVRNVSWAGIAVLDSSSYNVFLDDSLVNTSGVILRRYWTGRYAFPSYILNSYAGRIGTNNRFRRIVSVGFFSAFRVYGMDSTFVDSSYLEVRSNWGYALLNAGSRVILRNSILKGTSTPSNRNGYGISLEYFYGEFSDASSIADDELFEMYMENNTILDFAYGVRVMDVETSYIKLDTLFDDNDNQILGNTYGHFGIYRLPILVQTLDMSCTPTNANIDSVVIVDAFGYRVKLSKTNNTDKLYTYHYSSVPYTHYDSLYLWYPAGVFYYNQGGNLIDRNPFTIYIYGSNSVSLPYSLNIVKGLQTYVDPCPGSGYPKTVDGRYLVIKLQYDPNLLPLSHRETSSKFVKLTFGKLVLNVPKGESMEIYSLDGKLVRSMRIYKDTRIQGLKKGIYILRGSFGTYKVSLF